MVIYEVCKIVEFAASKNGSEVDLRIEVLRRNDGYCSTRLHKRENKVWSIDVGFPYTYGDSVDSVLSQAYSFLKERGYRIE